MEDKIREFKDYIRSFSERLEEEYSIKLKGLELLELALTHPSFSSTKCNERLEFLGDSIVGFIIAEYLYRHYPNYKQGALTAHKANLVSKSTLAKLAAAKLNLGDYLLLGEGEREGRKKEGILADALESLIACIYLKKGIKMTKRFILNLFSKELQNINKGLKKDYKSELQILTQRLFKILPQYKVISEAGPSHAPEFYVGVYIKEELYGKGKGKNKKEAEQEAAAEAYSYIKNVYM